MNTSEITEALDAITGQLDEMLHEPVLDVGQSTMLAQASVRCAQVRKELGEFNGVPDHLKPGEDRCPGPACYGEGDVCYLHTPNEYEDEQERGNEI